MNLSVRAGGYSPRGNERLVTNRHYTRWQKGKLAEKKGFEPSIPFPVYSLSRGAPSTTRPPLRSRFHYAAWVGIARHFWIFATISRISRALGQCAVRCTRSRLLRVDRSGPSGHLPPFQALTNHARTCCQNPVIRGEECLPPANDDAMLFAYGALIRAACSRTGTQTSRSPDARCA